jgi:iron complex transport system ATP-binding protein
MKKTPFLTAEKLSIGYVERNGSDVLSRDINFELHPGELVCLIGPNGAGKSTLIRTIAGLQPALGGSITLMEKNIASYNPHTIAQMVSLVLTNPVSVTNMTSFDLVSLGRHPFTNWLGQLTKKDHQVIMKALKDVGAEHFTNREITHLSDGERQKVMIARALAQQPKVMILDEPTAFLDFPNRVEILAMLRRLANNNNQAVLLSTHDLNLAIGVADKMMIMDENGNLFIGAPEDLIINGSFEKAFNPKGALNFNQLEGTFSFHFKNGHWFAVEADAELLSVWTKKAIERLGFHVDPQAEIVIRVKQEEKEPIWILDTGQIQPEFDSIYALIQYLRQ